MLMPVVGYHSGRRGTKQEIFVSPASHVYEKPSAQSVCKHSALRREGEHEESFASVLSFNYLQAF